MKLPREQVTELTGRRFLGDFTDDEAQYRALLDAGVAFAQAYQLVPGVSLTDAQMAALTSDIVWLVSREVQLADGSVQKVLVPQLYALVDKNQSVNQSGLISAGGNINAQLTGNLFNNGTLAARGNLAISAADITNMVGTLQGNNVSLQASGGISSILGQIKARQDLLMSSGGDTLIKGGGISAGGNASLSAGGNFLLLAQDTGRQLRVKSARDDNGNPIGKGPVFEFEQSTYNQTGVNVNVGGNLSINAGGNIIAQGTQASAGGSTSLSAGESISITTAQQGYVNISSVQNKYKTMGGLTTVKTNEVHNDIDLKNTAATLNSGGSVNLSAGQDIALQGVQINSQGYNANAGGNYSEIAAYDIKEKIDISSIKQSGVGLHIIEIVVGPSATFKTNNITTTDIDSTRTALVSNINAGGGVVNRSAGGNAVIEGSIVSGAVVNPLTAGGTITVKGAMDTRQVEHSVSTSSLVWQSTDSKGNIQQTLHMPEIHGSIPAGASAYQGAGGVSVQLPKGSDLRTTIEALSAEPGKEYLKELGQRSDIDWQRVEVLNKSLDFSKSGLTQEATIAVIIVVSIFTAGAASSAGASVASGMGFATTTVAGTTTMATAGGAAVAAGVTAGATALASTAAVSLINNKGDIGAVFKELGSKENVQNLVVTMLTAGLTQGLLRDVNVNGQPYSSINAQSPFISQLGKNMLQGMTAATVQSAVTGQSLEDALAQNLKGALINTVGAQAANEIGKNGGNLGALGKDIAHALLGCAIGSATADNSSGCAAGAAGAVIGERMASWYGDSHGLGDLQEQLKNDPGNAALANQINEIKTNVLNLSKLVGAGSALLVGGDAAAMNIAMGTAVNAAENNYLNHTRPSTSLMALSDVEKYDRAVKECSPANPGACALRDQLAQLSASRDEKLKSACFGPNASQAFCNSVAQEASTMGNVVNGNYGGLVYANSTNGAIGLNTATVGPVTRPDNFQDQAGETTRDGILVASGDVLAGAVIGTAVAAGKVVW